MRPDDLTVTKVGPSKTSNCHSQNEKFNEAEESNFAEPTCVSDKTSSFPQNGIFCFRIGPGGTFGGGVLLGQNIKFFINFLRDLSLKLTKHIFMK